MDFFELINKRESCRNFDSEKKVDTELLKRCVEYAALAPSACNSQPWHFVVVNNPDIVPKVAKSVQDMGFNRFASDAPAFIVVCGKDATLASKFDGLIKDRNSFQQNDLGIAVSYLCLAATELGLSTCVMGWRNNKKVIEALGLSEKKNVHCVIAVGYTKDKEPRKKVRKPIDEVMTVME